MTAFSLFLETWPEVPQWFSYLLTALISSGMSLLGARALTRKTNTETSITEQQKRLELINEVEKTYKEVRGREEGLLTRIRGLETQLHTCLTSNGDCKECLGDVLQFFTDIEDTLQPNRLLHSQLQSLRKSVTRTK